MTVDNRTFYAVDAMAINKIATELELIRKTLIPLVDAVLDEKSLSKSNKEALQNQNPIELSVLAEKGELPCRTVNALYRANIHTMSDLAYVSKRDIKKVRNLGKKSLDNLLEVLYNYGVELADKEAEEPEDIQEGEIVYFCGDDYDGLKPGAALKVNKVYKRANNTNFCLPAYSCRLIDYTADSASSYYYLSPGQITRS